MATKTKFNPKIMLQGESLMALMCFLKGGHQKSKHEDT